MTQLRKDGTKPNGYWNYDACYEEAKKYNSKVAFKTNSNTAYQQARKNGWLKEYTWFIRPKRDYSSMKGKKPHNFKWDYNACCDEAKKYHSRTEFMKGGHGAYDVARRNKWLDDYYWFDEIDEAYKTKRGHCIYVYVWEGQKVAYVGLTHQKQQRHRDHLTKSNSAVYRYATTNNQPTPNPIYLEDKLTKDEAKVQEGVWEKNIVRWVTPC